MNPTLLLPGVALIVTGIGFKLALVPFHMWTPDVYQGAPAPVTAFVATVSKGAMFALLLRVLQSVGFSHGFAPVVLVFSIIAIASMFTGNLLALLREQCEAYPGLFLDCAYGLSACGFQVGGPMGASAVVFYLMAYFVMTLGAFAVVTVLSGQQRDADQLEDYRGLFWRRPGNRTGFHGYAAFAGRYSTDGRFSRQVLHRCRRRSRGSLGAHPDSGDYQRHRSLLLLANCDSHVPATGSRRSGSRAASTPGAGGNPGAGRVSRGTCLARSLPNGRGQCDPICNSQPDLKELHKCDTTLSGHSSLRETTFFNCLKQIGEYANSNDEVMHDYRESTRVEADSHRH